MFGKLFTKRRIHVDVDGLQSSADEGHGTIAAAPNAQELLQLSATRRFEQHPQQTVGASTPYEFAEHHTQKTATGHDSDAFQVQGPAAADNPSPSIAGSPAIQSLLSKTARPVEQKVEQHAVYGMPAATTNQGQHHNAVGNQPGMPALCQVASTADYEKLQEQQAYTAQHQIQPAAHIFSPTQHLQQLSSPGCSSQQQQDQSCDARNLAPATGYGSVLQHQQVSQTVEALQQKLLLEAKAREELEDMLLRYERHLKAETSARLAAEQKTEAAMLHAADVRQQLASNGRQAKQQDDVLAAEHAAVQQERAELEQMRMNFEVQLQTARNEVAKAQTSMSSNEERVRAVKAEARAELVAEYEMRLAAVMVEVERLREELAARTHLMTAEMERWKRQAAVNAAAVIEAKNEVMDRKRELDSTKDKMDHLIEKLYAGREGNVSLSGAIAAAANYQQVSATQFLQQQANSMSLHASGRSSMAELGTTARQLAYSGSAGRGPSFCADGHAGFNSSTAIHNLLQRPANAHSKGDSRALIPTVQQRALAHTGPTAAQGPGSDMQHNSSRASRFPPPRLIVSSAGALPQPKQQQHKLSAVLQDKPPHLQHLPPSPRSRGSRIPQPFLAAVAAAANDPSSPASTHHLPAVTSRLTGPQTAAKQQHTRSTSKTKPRKGESGSYAQLHQQQQLASPVGDAFGHVVSRYAQSAAQHSQGQQAKINMQSKQHTKKQQLPDRFAEGARNAAMITAMANKFG